MSVQIKFTTTEEFYKQIKLDAEENCRSISNEVAYIVKQYFTQLAPQPVFIPSSTPAVFTSPTRKPGVISAPEPEPEKDKPTGDPMATIAEMERYMSDPDNEYYQKIKNYFLYRDKFPERLVRLLNLAEENNLNVIAGEFEYAVQKALDIPITRNISRSEWKEILSYLK